VRLSEHSVTILGQTLLLKETNELVHCHVVAASFQIFKYEGLYMRHLADDRECLTTDLVDVKPFYSELAKKLF
jgi:hypothetical protein